uniref:Elongation of fatty acids protein n=1 Tax=Chrysotila carterae TaxID=13221 RepID=A0A7S4EVQ4_CHRCT
MVFNAETVEELRTPACGYRNMSNFFNLDVYRDIKPDLIDVCDFTDPLSLNDAELFNGMHWTRFTSRNWEIPVIACSIYLVMIRLMKSCMREQKPIRLTPVVICWNFGLSFFSFLGMIYCVPHLLFGPAGVISEGFYPAVCQHASTYGHGKVGLFVFLFIYSKLAELLDTFWLLLRKSPVIFLHWYHHVTVLLYCWHAYSIRIGTGLWFAAMNYSVHAIMYFYFGLTQCGPTGKRVAKRFAMLITSLQLIQMVMGIAVTVASVYYHYMGEVCYVSLTNSALGLIMYASYFVLFLQLFLSHYVYTKKPKRALPGEKATCPPGDVAALNAAADMVSMGRPVTRTKQN